MPAAAAAAAADDGPADALAPRDVAYVDGGLRTEQFVRVHPPRGPLAPELGDGPVVVVILHGGYWKSKYGIDTAACDTLAPFLAGEGFVAAEVEYRRCDHPGGGWPGTNDDVLAAWAAVPRTLASLGLLPPRASASSSAGGHALRMVVVGHSAGGTLALWLSREAEKRSSLGVGDSEVFAPALAVGIAPVTDLVAGHEQRLSDDGDAIERYMGGTPEGIPDAYAAASPVALLPTAVPAVIAIGELDDTVPPPMVAAYCERARACGCDVDNVVVEGADHFNVTDASHGAWRRIYDAVCARLAHKAA